MAKVYKKVRCIICGRVITKNGVSTASHLKAHNRLGDNVQDIDRHYTLTPQGQAKANASAAALKALKEAVKITESIYDDTFEDSPVWDEVYTAMRNAQTAYSSYGGK